jgi:hypothetical protein
MHPYIPHLLEDITATHRQEKYKAREPEPAVTNIMEVIANLTMAFEEPAHDIGYYSGLSAEQFPPPEQLKAKEMKLVCEALKKMMKSWNLRCILPKNLPPRLAYTTLIKALGRKIHPDSSFEVSFKYCAMNLTECEFQKYCDCLKK